MVISTLSAKSKIAKHDIFLPVIIVNMHMEISTFKKPHAQTQTIGSLAPAE
jgi:hypothetical protein